MLLMRLLGSKRGFVSFKSRDAGGSFPHHGESDEVVRLTAPAGKNLPERRSTTTITGDLHRGRIIEVMGQPVSSGANVNEASAMTVAAVTACVGLIADMIAKLPIYLYRNTAKGPQEIEGHPAQYLINSNPSYFHTPFELRQLMETGKGLGGNGYARVFRDSNFIPREIQWIAPAEITAEIVKKQSGERFAQYRINGVKEMLTRADVLHVRGVSRDGLYGLSPISLLRESIGTSISQTNAAGNLIRNGARFGGFLHSDSILKKEIVDEARDEFNRNYTGSVNAGKIPVLNGMFKFTAMNGMSMSDAQFIESRRFEIQEIARIYRIPPFMIGDSTASTTWGTGIEQQTLGFLNFSLDSHLVAWEQTLAMTLLTAEEQRSGVFFQFDRDQLANVALQAKASFFQTMRNIGAYSINDIRAKMGEPLLPSEIGDNYAQPLNSSSSAPKEPETPNDSGETNEDDTNQEES